MTPSITVAQACELDTSIKELCQHIEVSQLEPLSGGLSNRCWKITAQGRQFVWRPVSSISMAFDINRHQEYKVLYSLRELDLSPMPELLLDSGLLVEWVDGNELPADKALSVLPSLLADIHEQSHTELPLLSIKERCLHYWLQLHPENQTELGKKLAVYFEQQDTQFRFPPALCHFDLGYYNIIDNKGRYTVIDWEYASLGDPSQDLAMTIITNELEAEPVIERYCQQRSIDNTTPWQNAVAHWQPWVIYLGALWFRLGYQLWQQDEYLQRAEQYEHLLADFME